MAAQQTYAPPKRKEPGLIGKCISSFVQLVSWLLVSWLLSLVIEWGGMVYIWPEQGAAHAQAVFESDLTYLHPAINDHTRHAKENVVALAEQVIQRIGGLPWFKRNTMHAGQSSDKSQWQRLINRLMARYQRYIDASQWVTQTFVIRLALIVFSLPVFLCAMLVGAVDGLVERELRRWGGGRESSSVFNLARKSVIPAFVAACVIYISLPLSINPVLIILPFAFLQGLAVRITFERLKKYF